MAQAHKTPKNTATHFKYSLPFCSDVCSLPLNLCCVFVSHFSLIISKYELLLCFYIDLQGVINSHQSRFKPLILHIRWCASKEKKKKKWLVVCEWLRGRNTECDFCCSFSNLTTFNAFVWFEYFNMFHWMHMHSFWSSIIIVRMHARARDRLLAYRCAHI